MRSLRLPRIDDAINVTAKKAGEALRTMPDVFFIPTWMPECYYSPYVTKDAYYYYTSQTSYVDVIHLATFEGFYAAYANFTFSFEVPSGGTIYIRLYDTVGATSLWEYSSSSSGVVERTLADFTTSGFVAVQMRSNNSDYTVGLCMQNFFCSSRQFYTLA